MSLYNDLQSVAAGLFSQFKQGVVYYVSVRSGSGPADDPGPNVEISTPINATVRGVPSQFVRDGLAVASDLLVTTGSAPAGVTFSMQGFVQIDGVRYKIVQIMSVPAAGTVVVNKLIVRR